MASSSSHVPGIKNDVFISFQGPKIRNGFLSHLIKDLKRNQIDFFVDERLDRGVDISSTLLKEIEASQISLVIFSKYYARSTWCLEELVKILECKKFYDQIVIPVFYNIDPSHVRNQKGTYEHAFSQHEQKLKANKKLQIWRSALDEAAKLTGYHYKSDYVKESELIDKIVEVVLEKLSCIHPVEPSGLVGIAQTLANIKSLLVSDPEEVRILGIWGAPGIGKTTIARAVFDNISCQYEGCCFLENVREESKKQGLGKLGKELLSELLEEKCPQSKIKLRLKKVLIVLDDVGTPGQLKYLATEQISFGRGSRIIVTSRDKDVLVSGGVHVNDIHVVKELNSEESIKLFSLNAFRKSYPEKEYEELSKRAVAYAKGMPLALKVLGSFLRSKDIRTWGSALRKLRKYPNEQIQNVLKLSYDGLDDEEKEIFLDIAFFYKGEYRDYATRLLEGNKFFAADGIDSLENKALIHISNNNTIQMHDLIQQMGWEIVRQECKKDPGRRSRLGDIEEVYEVLMNNKGTDAVQGIILHASHIKGLQLSAETFKNMTKLRIIKFFSPWHVRSCNVHHPTSIESFSDKLSFLEWGGCPLKPLPSSYNPEMPVEHSMTNNQVKKLQEGVQEIMSLRRLNISRSNEWMEPPSISESENLEWADIWPCESFCNDHPHILSLSMIVTLNLVQCKDMMTLHSNSLLRSHRDYNVSFCCSLREWSSSSQEITDLTPKFEIPYSSIGSLDELRRVMLNGSRQYTPPIYELCCLRSLEEISVSDCKQINSKLKVHNLFDALHYLRELFLVGCHNICSSMVGCHNNCEVPIDIRISSLKYLGLRGSSIESLPGSIKRLSMLRTVYLRDCRRLQSIPELPLSIMHLDATNCTSLETVFTLTTSGLKQQDIASYFFSFMNCLNLDEKSLHKIMDNAYLSLMLAALNNFEGSTCCYPGNRLPEWLTYKQTMTKASITIQLPSAVDKLLGFVFCSVLPRFASKEMCPSYLHCLWYFEDGEKLKEPSRCNMALMELCSDHVFLWYDPHCCELIVDEVKRRGENHEGIMNRE